MLNAFGRYSALLVVGAAALVWACGGGGGDMGPNPSALVMAKAPTKNGDQQSGPVNGVLPSALRIIVTRDGNPESNANVTWSTTDGTVTPASGPSDATGIAATTWTLGPTAGAQSAQATVQGATGSPLVFGATATAAVPPPPAEAIGVIVGNIKFQSTRNPTSNPAVDTVAVNGVVTWTWTNTSSTPHSVQSNDTPSFTSSATLTGDGQTYALQFTQAGTYSYNCAVHGNAMTGRIVVR